MHSNSGNIQTYNQSLSPSFQNILNREKTCIFAFGPIRSHCDGINSRNVVNYDLLPTNFGIFY